jgi:hypothetical protein
MFDNSGRVYMGSWVTHLCNGTWARCAASIFLLCKHPPKRFLCTCQHFALPKTSGSGSIRARLRSWPGSSPWTGGSPRTARRTSGCDTSTRHLVQNGKKETSRRVCLKFQLIFLFLRQSVIFVCVCLRRMLTIWNAVLSGSIGNSKVFTFRGIPVPPTTLAGV